MAKIKVYELAKEVDKQSKEIIAFLQEKGIEVKAAQSSVEESAAEMVRKQYGTGKSASEGRVKEAEPSGHAAPPAESILPEDKKERGGAAEAKEGDRKPTEGNRPDPAKKKKKIIFVSNPQNSKMPGGQRPPMNAGRPRPGQGQNQDGRTQAGRVQPGRVQPGRPEPVKKEIQLGPNQMINKSTGKVMEMLPPKKPEPVPEVRKEEPVRKSFERPAQERGNQGRDFGRDAHREAGSRESGREFGKENANRQNNRGFAGRGQTDERRTSERSYGHRQGPGQGQGRPGGGNGNSRGTYQSSGTSQGSGRGFGGGERSQTRTGGQDTRFQNKKDNKGFAGESPIMQGDKHRDDQRRVNQSKDKRSRKDAIYEEKEQEIKNKNKAGRFIKPEPKAAEPEEKIKVITLPERLTIKELADKMKMQPAVIIKKLFLQGKIVTVNQEISFEDAENIAIEFDIMCEQEVKVDVIEELLREEKEAEESLQSRAPVICVMGHVDHGKTSLLDAIRKTNVTDREAGGITQHIGAYSVNVSGQKITFLDTPGHEAFTAMRMRGANATDIAILVVAADDGVMPQTVEAINHAKAAGIEIIVAVNKIDKPNANVDRVKQELTEHGLIAEDWGGSTVFAPVSAKSGEGIQEMLEMILLTADILELKANPARRARGLVIEAQLDKGRGPVATVLVQKGTLRVGDFISAGASHGKVRAMIDDKGRRVKEAGPSTPVEILGLNDVPNAGEVFLAHDNDKTAKSYAETFVAQNKEKKLEETKTKMSLDDLFHQIQEGNLKELNLIVKADVQGSVEAVKQSLMKLSNEEVVVKCIHGGVGAINESDVTLAATSSAIIIGFNVRPEATAKATAEQEGVDIRLYKVIYQAIEDIEAAMKGMLDPVFEEKVIGHAEVRQIFRASQIGNIAGSYVLDGVFQRGCKVRISREGKQIFEGNLASLRRFKDDVKEVRAGYECGLVFEGFDQMQELDIVESYIMVEVPR
ncbi:MAG: translation initiation factor IF-2 [Lachnospiraceae bacterium]|nr:translation initiation factor IF-2 [Lachnospiraceae bacterium]